MLAAPCSRPPITYSSTWRGKTDSSIASCVSARHAIWRSIRARALTSDCEQQSLCNVWGGRQDKQMWMRGKVCHLATHQSTALTSDIWGGKSDEQVGWTPPCSSNLRGCHNWEGAHACSSKGRTAARHAHGQACVAHTNRKEISHAVVMVVITRISKAA